MTKFHVMSDTHQEFWHKEQVIKKDWVKDADFLLLAGDLTAGSMPIDYIKDLGKPGAYVLGNHEFYKRHWDDCIKEYKMRFQDSPISVLERDVIIFNNVRIVGCTLWTDFLAPVKGKPVFDVTPSNTDEHFIEDQTFYCRKGMSDFDVIKGITTSGWRERYFNSVAYLKLILSQKHNGPTIVITHHAPSFKSSHPRWENSAIKGGFCSMLDYVIEEYQPELWVHGHCHDSSDYPIGNTRVICNPHGYPKENMGDFKPYLTVEL